MRDADKSREDLLGELQKTRIRIAQMLETEAGVKLSQIQFDQLVRVSAAIVQSAPFGLLVFRSQPPDELILEQGNPEAVRLIGATMDQLRGTSIEEIWPDASEQGVKRLFLETMETGETAGIKKASYANHSGQRTLRISAFRLTQDQLGVYIEDAASKEASPELPVAVPEDPSKIEEASVDEGSLMVEELRRELEEAEIEDAAVAEGDAEDSDSLDSREELARRIEEISAQLALANERLAEETGLRVAAEEVVEKSWRELENRVRERTEELAASNELMQRQLTECHQQEEALRAVRDDLEKRVRHQETEIAELAELMEIEIEERKKTEEQLVSIRMDLERRMTEADEELELANERLKGQIAERQSVEDELRTSISELARFLQERDAQLSELTEQLDFQRMECARSEEPQADDLVSMIHNAPLGMFSLDDQGTIHFTNPKAMEIFGATSEENLKSVNMMDSQQMVECGLSATIKDCLRLERPFTGLFRFVSPWGKQVAVRAHLVPIPQQEGRLSGADVILEDTALPMLKEARTVRDERFNALSQMAGGFADKLSGVLGSVSKQAQAALVCFESASFSDMAPMLESVLNTSREAARTARRLRQFALFRPRIESRRGNLFDLSEVVKESIEMDALWSRPDQARDGFDVSVESSLTPNCTVQGEEEDFLEVMANLLENAAEAMPTGGTISVETLSQGREVVLRVKDGGAGVASAAISKVFDPFWSTKTGHDGLGLPVVLGVVHRHGGRIALSSGDGAGTTVTVRLPYAERSLQDGETGPEEPAQGNYRILLVYDLEPVARMVRNKLTRLGYGIFVARSTQECVDIVQRIGMDAIIIDSQEGGLSPWEVSSAVHATCRSRGIAKPPIIALTGALDQLPDSTVLSRSCADRIVEKPVSIARLIEIVREEIQGAESSFPELIG